MGLQKKYIFYHTVLGILISITSMIAIRTMNGAPIAGIISTKQNWLLFAWILSAFLGFGFSSAVTWNIFKRNLPAPKTIKLIEIGIITGVLSNIFASFIWLLCFNDLANGTHYPSFTILKLLTASTGLGLIGTVFTAGTTIVGSMVIGFLLRRTTSAINGEI